MTAEGLTEAERAKFCICSFDPPMPEDSHAYQCSTLWKRIADRLAAVQAELQTSRRFGRDRDQEAGMWQHRAESAEAERDALRERVEALAEDWDAPLGNYQWFATQVRAALDADRSTDPSAGSERG